MNINLPESQITRIADDIIIIDDFMPEALLQIIDEIVYSHEWPWFYLEDTTYRAKHNNRNQPTWDDGFSTLIYVHVNAGDPDNNTDKEFIFKSPFYNYFQPMFSHIDFVLGFPIDKLKRAKVNLNTTSISDEPFEPHIDVPRCDTWSGLLCLNDSDGPTVIYKNKCPDEIDEAMDALKYYREHSEEFEIIAEVQPKRGRFVLFDGRYFHSGTRPMKHKNRININFNWYK